MSILGFAGNLRKRVAPQLPSVRSIIRLTCTLRRSPQVLVTSRQNSEQGNVRRRKPTATSKGGGGDDGSSISVTVTHGLAILVALAMRAHLRTHDPQLSEGSNVELAMVVVQWHHGSAATGEHRDSSTTTAPCETRPSTVAEQHQHWRPHLPCHAHLETIDAILRTPTTQHLLHRAAGS